METLLVTDGEERAALAVVRSLGRAGHRIVVASPGHRPLAAASRWCRAVITVPSPLRDPAGYAAAVSAGARRHGARTLLPVSEASWLALFPLLDEGFVLPGPDPGAFRAVSDKRHVLEVAHRLGMAVPRQVVLETPEDLAATAAGCLPSPAWVKPSRSVAGGAEGRTRHGVAYAPDAARLAAAVAAYPESAYPLLVQESVEGDGEGVFLLVWNGEVEAAFAHRRLREKPPGGGVSVYRESRQADPDLVAASRRLLAAFGWRGVAMVEYRVERGSGRPVLMEVNGRFWGSLQLAADAGVDFPARLVELAAGRRPPPPGRYRDGVRSRWMWGDVDHFYARLRNGHGGVGGVLRAAGQFLAASGPGTRSEILRIDDPRPFLRESVQWFRRS